MVRKKKPYVSPDISETQVQLESPICSGSVDITAQAPAGGVTTESQTINHEFQSDNTFASDAGWDTTPAAN